MALSTENNISVDVGSGSLRVISLLPWCAVDLAPQLVASLGMWGFLPSETLKRVCLLAPQLAAAQPISARPHGLVGDGLVPVPVANPQQEESPLSSQAMSQAVSRLVSLGAIVPDGHGATQWQLDGVHAHTLEALADIGVAVASADEFGELTYWLHEGFVYVRIADLGILASTLLFFHAQTRPPFMLDCFSSF